MEIEVKDTDFSQKVLKSDLPCLVDLWAEWCAPCHFIAPILKEIAKEYEGIVGLENQYILLPLLPLPL